MKNVRKYRMFKETNEIFVVLVARYVTVVSKLRRNFLGLFLVFLGGEVSFEVIAFQFDAVGPSGNFEDLL